MTDASFSLFPPRQETQEDPSPPPADPPFTALATPVTGATAVVELASYPMGQSVYDVAPPPISADMLTGAPHAGTPVTHPALMPPPPPGAIPLVVGDPDLMACLQYVVNQGGSDLHLSVNAHPRMRLHGVLADVPFGTAWSADKMESALRSVLTEKQQAHFDEKHELDFALTVSRESRFRVNVYQQRGFMGAAFRLVPTEIRSISDLGVPRIVERFASLPRGLVLVTGPTGSGKSTTLAALLDIVNRTRADHIVTVEDPIEFIHENRRSLVNQREVGQDTHSFTAALKHVLRQDPDVILIGELRDLETISTALTAAETGHLVFATLHTQSAAQTVDRIIDVFPPHQQSQVRAQLASTLQGVVCQTLVPRAVGGGRLAATEILVMVPAIANLIREGKTFQIPSALQAGRDSGMHTLDQHLAELVNHGLITHQHAMERAQDLESLNQLIHRSQAMRDVRTTGGF